MERQSDKELKASKSLEANRKYRQNMRDKISLVQKDDTRLDELLDRIKLIQKRLGDMSDSDSNSDTESEPDQIEPAPLGRVVKKPEIKKAEPKKEVKKSEIKKAEPKKEEPPDVEPARERKYMHNYPAFV